MKKVFLFAMVIVSSCSSGLSGDIEKRQDGKIYLVNKSTDKAYQFTVKKTIISIVSDSPTYQYETQKVKLSPGDERSLGVDNEDLPQRYPTTLVFVREFYKIVPESKGGFGDAVKIRGSKQDGPHIRLVSKKNMPKFEKVGDTIINGERIKYGYLFQSIVDSLHPLPKTFYRYKYEVTGQLEFKK